MDTLKIGLIGAGTISQFHLESYQNNKQVEIYAICDINAQRAEAAAKKYDVARWFMIYKEMLADPAIDAVSICTINHLHAEIAIAALDAGKHVLLEKPLCMTVEEALLIQAAVKRSGKTLQVGFVRRFGTNALVLQQFIEAGDLGEVYYAKASFLRRLGNPGGWFADKQLSGGGPLIDIGVHIIDLCWYMMGRPKVKSISGNTYHKLGNRDHIKNLSKYEAADYNPLRNLNTVEDLANALIRFENGSSLLIDVSYSLHAANDELSIKVFGDKGGAEIEPALCIVTEKHDTILNMTPQIDQLTFDMFHAFQNEIDHFVECCLQGTATKCPVEDGVEIMKLLCGIYESSEKGIEIHYS